MENSQCLYAQIYRSFSRITNMSQFSNIQITFDKDRVLIKNKFTPETRLEYKIKESTVDVVYFDNFGEKILGEMKKDIDGVIGK